MKTRQETFRSKWECFEKRNVIFNGCISFDEEPQLTTLPINKGVRCNLNL